MTKAVVTRLFLGGIVAIVAGLVLGFSAVWAAYSAGGFVMDGPDVTGIRSIPYAWAMVAAAIVGIVAIIGGAVAGLVAWIGALLNTAQLADKTWFIVLLVLGLMSFGSLAMIAYVIAGPDGTRHAPAPRAVGAVN